MDLCTFESEEARTNESVHDKTNNITFAPSEDFDQPGHPPSLIRIFAVCIMGNEGPNASLGGQRRLIRLGECTMTLVETEATSAFTTMLKTQLMHLIMPHVGFKPAWMQGRRFALLFEVPLCTCK